MSDDAMTPDDAIAWARRWIDAWNRRDVDAVLTHFADDVEFRSPLAATVVGAPGGVVHGRAALREYWTTALRGHPGLHFELDEVFVGAGCLAIHYRNEAGRHVSEVAVFGADGKVARGYAMYAA